MISTGNSNIAGVLIPDSKSVFLLSSQGNIKRMDWKDVVLTTRRGSRIMNLKKGETLVRVFTSSSDLLLFTHKGMGIRFHSDLVRTMGRSSGGEEV